MSKTFSKQIFKSIQTILRKKHDFSNHPDVVAGEKTEKEVFEDLLLGFGEAGEDLKITLEDWIEYYSIISYQVADDVNFIQLLLNCWTIS